MAAPQTLENWVGLKRKALAVIRRLLKFLLSDVKISPLKILSRRVMWPDFYFKRILCTQKLDQKRTRLRLWTN